MDGCDAVIGKFVAEYKEFMIVSRFTHEETGKTWIMVVNGNREKSNRVWIDTVGGKKVADDHKADVDTDDKFTPDTEVIENGVFMESKFRSAPYFDLRIDGITEIQDK